MLRGSLLSLTCSLAAAMVLLSGPTAAQAAVLLTSTNSVTPSPATVTVGEGSEDNNANTSTESGSVTISAPTQKNLTWTQGSYTATFSDVCTAQSGYVKVTKSKSATLSITAPSGVSITQVVLTYGENTNEYSGSTVTFTLPSTSSVTGIGSAAKNQDGSVIITFANTNDIYASKVVVYYGNGGDTTPTVTTSTFKVAKDGTYSRNESLWNDNKTARATLGGWMFPNSVATNKKITSEGLGEDGDWGSIETPKADGDEYVEGYEYRIGEGSNKNARQEQGSNAQPMSKGIYNGKLESQGSVVDPMFNVPCSGAYLVFAAKEPGTITANIFQNGVFDKSNKSIQYRPQRRVFVLDEAGNIVPATAKLLNDKGSLPSDKATDYSWDLGTMPTTADGVKAHFVNLTDFSFTKGQFKNGVYESALDYDTCKNEALNNTELKDVTGKGYRGWAVLADAPVSYTFDVKPGKTYYLYNFGSRIGFYGFSFTTSSKAKQDDAISYKQDDANTITASEEGHYASVSIDRTFKGGVWNAAVLPFSMNKQQVDSIFGTTYSKDHADGTQIIYFDRIQNDSIFFVRHAYNTIVAGKPFLIKPSKTGDITINTASVTDFPYVTIEKTQPDTWVADKGFEWVSDFGTQTISVGDYYISASGRVSHRTSGTASLKGFRGYLKAQTSAAKKMTLVVANDDNTGDSGTATGIAALEMDTDGNYVERPLAGRVYNAHGQMVATDASQLGSLPRGLYIINGKKYVK